MTGSYSQATLSFKNGCFASISATFCTKTACLNPVQQI